MGVVVGVQRIKPDRAAGCWVCWAAGCMGRNQVELAQLDVGMGLTGRGLLMGVLQAEPAMAASCRRGSGVLV
jgi:hypothetical protein